MDFYSTLLICGTVLTGILILACAGVICFRIFVRFEERNSIREQETIAHKARLYAEKDIGKSYLENMAQSFGMYPPVYDEAAQTGPEALLSFINTPEGQAILTKLGLNLNKENRQ